MNYRTHHVSAVISTWNCEKTIGRCLNSLAALGITETIVCDQGSSDGTAELVTSGSFTASFVRLDGATSFAKARNIGLAMSTQPLVLFLDGDWLADGSCVNGLLHELELHPRCALVVPRFVDDSGGNHIGHNVRRFPTTEALACEFLMLHKLLKPDAVNKYRMLDFDHLSHRNVDHACGAFVLARRESLLNIGGYDESLEGAWMEDVDLGQRLQQGGWHSRFCASASALHLGRETIRHFFIEQHYDAYYRSVLRYASKYLPNSYDFLRICLLAGLTSKAAFSYGLPAGLRARLLRSWNIYNSDEAIQSYRQMYLRAIDVVRRMSTPC